MDKPNVKKEAWLRQNSNAYQDNIIDENSISASDVDSVAATVRGKKLPDKQSPDKESPDKENLQSMNSMYSSMNTNQKESKQTRLQQAETFDGHYVNSFTQLIKGDENTQKLAKLAEQTQKESRDKQVAELANKANMEI